MNKTICAEEAGCKNPTAGQSKYCKAHRAESRIRFKAMLKAQDAERAERDEMFALVWESAVEAGIKACALVTVGASSKPAQGKVAIRPSNCAFANWVVRHGFGHKVDARKAVVVTLDDNNGTEAFAEEVRGADIRCTTL